jgi:hypothetical protein
MISYTELDEEWGQVKTKDCEIGEIILTSDCIIDVRSVEHPDDEIPWRNLQPADLLRMLERSRHWPDMILQALVSLRLIVCRSPLHQPLLPSEAEALPFRTHQYF